MQGERIKYYLDTHISKAVALQLRSKGVDVVRCEEVGMAEADDLEHLEYATLHGRVVVSHDEDFLRKDKEWKEQGKRHAGIMSNAHNLQGKEHVGRIINELLEYDELIRIGAGTLEEDIANRVIFIRRL